MEAALKHIQPQNETSYNLEAEIKAKMEEHAEFPLAGKYLQPLELDILEYFPKELEEREIAVFETEEILSARVIYLVNQAQKS